MRLAGLEQQAPFAVLNIGFRIENEDFSQVMEKFLFEVSRPLPLRGVIRAELHLQGSPRNFRRFTQIGQAIGQPAINI